MEANTATKGLCRSICRIGDPDMLLLKIFRGKGFHMPVDEKNIPSTVVTCGDSGNVKLPFSC